MPEFAEIGQNIIDEVGLIACEHAYDTTDPHWVGVFAVQYGDAERDGTLN